MKDGIIIFIGVIAAIGVVLTILLDHEKSVTISSSQFSCTEAEPFGIETKCTQYSRIKGVK